MAGSRAQARPGKGIRILRILGEIQYMPKVGVGFGGAVGARYPFEGAESPLADNPQPLPIRLCTYCASRPHGRCRPCQGTGQFVYMPVDYFVETNANFTLWFSDRR